MSDKMSCIINAIAATIREIGQPDLTGVFIVASEYSEVANHDTILGMEVKITSANFHSSFHQDFILVGGFDNKIPAAFDKEFMLDGW